MTSLLQTMLRDDAVGPNDLRAKAADRLDELEAAYHKEAARADWLWKRVLALETALREVVDWDEGPHGVGSGIRLTEAAKVARRALRGET